MKNVFAFLLASSILSFAFAAESVETYVCTSQSNNQEQITIQFDSDDSVTVIDVTGDDYILSVQKNKSQSKDKVYADYNYDGYGGSVELKIPASFSLAGGQTAEEFSAQFAVEQYSEAGHVSGSKFAGTCQRTDN